MSLYKNRSFLVSTGTGLAMLVASLGAVFYTTNYANLSASNSVTDIILSNTRVYDIDVIFVYGALLLVLLIATLLLLRPQYLPFSLKSVAFFYFVRSLFVSLTHLSAYPYRATLDAGSFFITSQFFRVFFTGDDLFFSGHVGLPFLLALIFWDKVLLRTIFLASSIVFAVVVLLGHLHYSIDVFSAYFITYSIYVLARRFFHSDFMRIAQHTAPIV